ncbi:MAG: stage III sporulation protein AG [Paenibacillaceae bacterium]|uniref:Stage III sporulation protein AG n=1 Tax=Paenibacillus mellifer TaxID=2937794 RepID=A0A9X2BMY0_9BACL|nr:stage III sporulation protein AG [Paenibacillus mellifer]MBW4840115.1 stage III sporulation protein AG [Paenibacillaceae bacterium]MCK8486214.1 stage III sporulation protein AG [Paenibacillus mellifer]
MPGWLKKLEQWLGRGTEGKKTVSTFRWLLILGLVGIAIMLFNSFVNVKQMEPNGEGSREPPMMQEITGSAGGSSGTGDDDFSSIEMTLEGKTKEILEKIVGVGAVDVLVTIDSTEEIVVQRNIKDSQELTEESDADGGKRHITQYTRDGQIVTYEASGSEQPIVTKKIKPKVRGVLIVARGAENKTVKSLIVDAVEKGLNVPAYRISVVPRKQSQ